MTSPVGGLSGGSNFSNDRSKKSQSQDKPKEVFVRKYSNDIPLAEQILIGGRSKFLQLINGLPRISDHIDLSIEKGIILKPHKNLGFTPIIEYEYNDIKEIEYFIELASRMSVDDLYFLVKSIWEDVAVTKEKELIILLATNTIMSYFQDLFVTTPYLLLIGPPGWGKGAILVTFKLLGYRVVLAGDMSGANLLDLLGSVERCQVSVAEDELDDIENDGDKKRIYKMGYEDIGLVTRTVDPSSSERTIKFYNPYCLKIFACEKAPDSKELGGFNDRTFRADVMKGKPKLLVKEIKKQMERSIDKQLPKYKVIISRINFLRKVSLIYRLLHHSDSIEEIPLNIYGRALELCGPAIRLFNSEKLARKDRGACKEIIDALGYFLRKKGELDEKTIEVVIYTILKDIFDQMDIEERTPGTSTLMDNYSCRKETHQDVHGVTRTTYFIAYDEICVRIMKEVDGNLVSQRSFESSDYGRITHDGLLAKCRSVFQGQSANLGSGKNKKRALAFHKDIVDQVGQTFAVISEIKIIGNDDDRVPDNPKDSEMWNEWTGGTNGQFFGQYEDKGEVKGDNTNGPIDSQDL